MQIVGSQSDLILQVFVRKKMHHDLNRDSLANLHNYIMKVNLPYV